MTLSIGSTDLDYHPEFKDNHRRLQAIYNDEEFIAHISDIKCNDYYYLLYRMHQLTDTPGEVWLNSQEYC
jgi:hypothetical protein